MARHEPQIDALVLGEHPAGYLAAALLASGTGRLRVHHAPIPGESAFDRRVIINPALFKLHPLIESLKRRLDLIGAYGLQFLADDRQTQAEYRGRSAAACIGGFAQLRDAMRALAESNGVILHAARPLEFHALDEKGIELSLGSAGMKPKVLLVAAELSAAQRRFLGLSAGWEPGIVHRQSQATIRGTTPIAHASRPLVPMSVDLGGNLDWAWMLPSPGGGCELLVQQSGQTMDRISPRQAIDRWIEVLRSHGAAPSGLEIDSIQTLNIPLAGALTQEGLGNRTVQFGPAGGFYSAAGEDIYPNCWSAVFAADAARKALKERHLQDALQPYRHKWRTTLGEYLRGPQQNLRYLLPLVYRKQPMTDRLAESILFGKSLVR